MGLLQSVHVQILTLTSERSWDPSPHGTKAPEKSELLDSEAKVCVSHVRQQLQERTWQHIGMVPLAYHLRRSSVGTHR